MCLFCAGPGRAWYEAVAIPRREEAARRVVLQLYSTTEAVFDPWRNPLIPAFIMESHPVT